MAVRNYAPGDKWKIGRVIDREGTLHYKVKVGSLIWKRHIDQMSSVGEEAPLEEEDRLPNTNASTEERGISRNRELPGQVRDITIKSKTPDVYLDIPPTGNTLAAAKPGSQIVPEPGPRRSNRTRKTPERLKYT